MAQKVINVRMDADLKDALDEFCDSVGMNVSVAINMFAKAVVREQKLPFEIKADPFYSKTNQHRLEKAVADLDAGKGRVHETIEDDYDE